MTCLIVPTALLLTIILAAASAPRKVPHQGDVFARENLVAWCIVPFDVKKRGPEERAQMLRKLGFRNFAYDWREEHVATFDRELDALKKHHIALQAFWMPYGPDPAGSRHYAAILSLLKRHHVKTQLWWSYGSSDESLARLTQDQKVALVGDMVRTMADDAAKIGCTVGLYGHNGWFGEPDNELAILEYVRRPNVGLVYNFNHAEAQIDRFPEFFPRILPHLIALNLAGLQNGKPGKIVPIGQGDSEQEMIRLIGESGYAGPIGIINENTDPDAERGLSMNIEGLKSILGSLAFTGALRTYK
jgi:sugar phosphate isomerase/epimerase